jgi:hypothetical protein
MKIWYVNEGASFTKRFHCIKIGLVVFGVVMYHHANAQPNKALVFMTLCVCACVCVCVSECECECVCWCVCLCIHIYHHIISQPGKDLVFVALFDELELLVFIALVNAQPNRVCSCTCFVRTPANVFLMCS